MEICGKETLNALCRTIIASFDFTDEHMYEFCMDNRMYGNCSYQSNTEFGGKSTKISLDKLHLEKGQKFTLHYDFGDDWMFPISVVQIEQIEQYHAPRIIKTKGTVEQY